jgi:hypothetical protein
LASVTTFGTSGYPAKPGDSYRPKAEVGEPAMDGCYANEAVI